MSDSGETENIREPHAAYFLSLVDGAEPHLVGPHQVAWLDRLEVEHDNLRAALEFFAGVRRIPESGSDRRTGGLRLSSALSRFWFVRGYFVEGRIWLGQFLDLTTTDGRTKE